jgi:2,4-dienoyl-CoA reductase-like NADH-dependent reductase (Old Yellow Enzyme family)
MSQEELVERVARAIHKARGVRLNPDRPDSDHEYSVKLARAAITALETELAQLRSGEKEGL